MFDWSTTAFVFPGQGSQIVGMGQDLYNLYPAAREVFQEADTILGYALSQLCFHGPEDHLNDTLHTQPALYVHGIAMFRALRSELPEARPACAAGHSLGELTALAAVGAMPFDEGLRLVRERARAMQQAGQQQPGAMAAVLGLNVDRVREICTQASQQTGGVLVLANDNCPGQLVISGDEATLNAGMHLLKAAGAKRVVRLAVSIAAHSPLMAAAADAYEQQIAETHFHAPQVPVYANVSAEALDSIGAIKAELSQQLTQPVRWTECVQAMIAAGMTHFLELGPGDVLTGLLKRIDRERQGYALNTIEGLRRVVDVQRVPPAS